MGLKFSGMGLLYNDNSFNIQTSSKSGKYHFVTCPYCLTPNKISLETIKEKKEIDDSIKKEKFKKGILDEFHANRAHYLSFVCGRCKRKLSTTITDDKSSDIYTNKEYNNEVQSITDSMANKKFKTNNQESIRKMLND